MGLTNALPVANRRSRHSFISRSEDDQLANVQSRFEVNIAELPDQIDIASTCRSWRGLELPSPGTGSGVHTGQRSRRPRAGAITDLRPRPPPPRPIHQCAASMAPDTWRCVLGSRGMNAKGCIMPCRWTSPPALRAVAQRTAALETSALRVAFRCESRLAAFHGRDARTLPALPGSRRFLILNSSPVSITEPGRASLWSSSTTIRPWLSRTFQRQTPQEDVRGAIAMLDAADCRADQRPRHLRES